jgi:hypothetical protein
MQVISFSFDQSFLRSDCYNVKSSTHTDNVGCQAPEDSAPDDREDEDRQEHHKGQTPDIPHGVCDASLQKRMDSSLYVRVAEF